MQLLLDASKAGLPDEVCARQVLDTVPMVMRVIRNHMRRHRCGLTVPQFRTLCYVSTSGGSSLSAVADFVGLSLPAMSRLVDGLVEKRLMERRPSDDDRRHVRLWVTRDGETSLSEAREMAQAELAKALGTLNDQQRALLMETMKTLHDVFSPQLSAGDEGAGKA